MATYHVLEECNESGAQVDKVSCIIRRNPMFLAGGGLERLLRGRMDQGASGCAAHVVLKSSVLGMCKFVIWDLH